MSAAEEHPRPLRQIGIYRLDEKIGSGAMGTVYRATHMTLGKQVALKLVHTDDPDGELCQRFLQEGIAAARVRHPNVVEVLDAGRDGDVAYLAMQLLDGETLGECIARQGRLPVTYAVDLILPVCAALMAAHKAGVLHRDLKPANIFLTDVGRGEPEPILLDFGISKLLGPVDAALTQNPRFLGTPLYIAPEQAEGAPGSQLSDQYSLALSLYECLLGVRPYEKYASSLIQLLRRVAEGEIKPPRELDAAIPEELDEALCRALSTNPAERFASMREFGAALLPFASATRSALWQHSFIDAERTMTSVSSPVSNSRNSRRVQVSVEHSARTSQPPDERPSSIAVATFNEDGEDDSNNSFISHSMLFGDSASEPRRSAYPDSVSRDSVSRDSASRDSVLPDSRDYYESKRRNVERSSISRRSFPPTQKEEFRDPYSQLPSGRPTSESWSREASEMRAERNSIGTKAPSSWQNSPPSTSRLTWILSGVLLAATVFAAVTLVRFDLERNQPKLSYPVSVESIPIDARIDLDGLQVGTGSFHAKFAQDGALHRIQVSRPGYESIVVAFQDEAPPHSIRLRRLETLNPSEGVAPQNFERSQLQIANKSRSPATKAAAASQNDLKLISSASEVADEKAHLGQSTTSTRVPAGATELGSSSQASVNSEPSAPQTDPAAASPSQDKMVTSASSDHKTETPSKNEKPIQTGNLDPWAK